MYFSKCPYSILNAALDLSSVLTGICQKPLAQSTVEKYFDFPSESNTSEITGMGKLSPTVTSFNLRKSTTTLHFLLPEESSFLGTTKMGEFHGLELCWITPSDSICSVCLCTSSLCTFGIRYGFMLIALWGSTVGVGIACSMVEVRVNLSFGKWNTSLYSSHIVTLDAFSPFKWFSFSWLHKSVSLQSLFTTAEC